jgi:hypothetical protein
MRAGAFSEQVSCLSLLARAWGTIPRHEQAPDWGIERKACRRLSLGKGSASGSPTVMATKLDHDAYIIHIEEISGMDIPSGRAKSVEV